MSDPFASVSSGPGVAADGLPVDEVAPRPVLSSERLLRGQVWDVARERVDLGEAGVVTRDLVDHPGAVGICVLDGQDRLLLVRQYRHPVGTDVWELPAGLLDVDGEPASRTAARELAEEADLEAVSWHVLLDWYMSPGGSSEAFRLFLVRDLRAVPVESRHDRRHEEAGMRRAWLPLESARDLVLGGRLHGPNTVVGVLAACAARDAGWSSLQPVDAPWPTHPRLRG